MEEALKSGTSAIADISLSVFLIGLVETVVLSYVLRWHHVRFATTLSNRHQFANVMVPLAVTTFLVILVVKSSLALSLGLVGALSIVRFRTPIKEPEDLVYLFMAIGLGLGVGAGQFLVTGGTLLALLIVIPLLHKDRITNALDYDFFVDVATTTCAAEVERTVINCVRVKAKAANLTKIERARESVQIAFSVRIDSEESLLNLIDEIMLVIPDARCTFLDTKAVFT